MMNQVDAKLSDVHIIQILKDAGLRPTRQRIFIGGLLFGQEHRHVSADILHIQISTLGQKMALATIYNCLHQFHKAGLLKQVNAVKDVIMFDTNLDYHHHFLNVDTGELTDIDESKVSIGGVPSLPDGFEAESMELIIRVKQLNN
ncbi:transcriptional repressor [Alphaproteobacteria bacterium]|nr:transcriptional repressor [Alphaproteobacteria bacterium]